MKITIDCGSGKKTVEATEVIGTPFAIIEKELLNCGSRTPDGIGYSATHIPTGKLLGAFGWYCAKDASDCVAAWWDRLPSKVHEQFANNTVDKLTPTTAGVFDLRRSSDFDFVDDGKATA